MSYHSELIRDAHAKAFVDNKASCPVLSPKLTVYITSQSAGIRFNLKVALCQKELKDFTLPKIDAEKLS